MENKITSKQKVIAIISTIVISIVAIALITVYFIDIKDNIKTIIYFSSMPFQVYAVILFITSSKKLDSDSMKYYYPLFIITVLMIVLGFIFY